MDTIGSADAIKKEPIEEVSIGLYGIEECVLWRGRAGGEDWGAGFLMENRAFRRLSSGDGVVARPAPWIAAQDAF